MFAKGILNLFYYSCRGKYRLYYYKSHKFLEKEITINFYKRYFFKFKYFIRYNIPNSIWESLSSLVSSLRVTQYKQKYKSYGILNPDVTFYVIRMRPPAWGFFAGVTSVLQGIMYAEEHKLIPVVDMENYWVAELSSTKKINGTYNAWCYFFEQISDFSLEEVYKSKNVILSEGSRILGNNHWFTDRKLLYLREINHLKTISEIINKHIKLNKITLDNFNKIRDELNWIPSQTLGVFIRGTAYRTNSGVNDMPPALESIIANVKNTLSEKNLNNLYISTEDYEIYSTLCKELKDFNIVPNIRYKKTSSVENWQKSGKVTPDGGILLGYDRTLNYLVDILLISECESCIATLSNASVFFLSKRFHSLKKSKLVINTGVYDL